MIVMEKVINGVRERVHALRNGDEVWIHIGGETYKVSQDRPADTRTQKSAPTRATGAGAIRAPMPGKITKVFATVGAAVSPGVPLVVMEAMKMEYTLRAEVACVVVRVAAREGRMVALDDILVELAPGKTS